MTGLRADKKAAAIKTSSTRSGYLVIASTMIRDCLGAKGKRHIIFPMLLKERSLSRASSMFRVSMAPIMPFLPGGEIKSKFSKSRIPSSAIRITTSDRSVR